MPLVAVFYSQNVEMITELMRVRRGVLTLRDPDDPAIARVPYLAKDLFIATHSGPISTIGTITDPVRDWTRQGDFWYLCCK